MNDLKGLRVVVAGAGAIGSVTAWILALRGATITLADPADLADNASGVAAGMLAPAAEALLDPKASSHFPLLKAARDLWDELLPDLPEAALDRSGALIRAADPQALLERAAAMGAILEPADDEAARRRAPGLAPAGPYLFTPEDWRLEPRPMLQALHRALTRRGGRLSRGRALALTEGRVTMQGADAVPADALVLATGPGPGDLAPIKGQILRFLGAGPATGAVVRGEGVYVAPSSEGAVAGATMEEGRADRAIDPDAVARLKAAALRLFPALAAAEVRAFAGVRAATPDGLPLAGPLAGPLGEAGVFAARGARRNGWLLAPLVAGVIAERLAGRAPSAWAQALDPARFGGPSVKI